jgi:flagellar biosynthesis protein FlhA
VKAAPPGASRSRPEGGEPRRAAMEAAWPEMAVPLAVLGIVFAMIVPLPPWMVDLLIALNITLSVVVLLVGVSIARPVDFSVFPTTLLLLTLFRLALNISSSRLILLAGNTGTAAAGHMIEAFGSFVVGGNYLIGAVIFLVLIAIQYVVINHGAVRISEVTARFSLDALPGKQMSIDSDLNAGLIEESEARTRRRQLAAEAEFYGAMDGASRFTQRDAIASILITAINIIAGFLIGVFQHGMELRRALETYTVLTIGDGLVTVIPALMISVAGGLIVTRASSGSNLSADFRRQVLDNPQPLLLTGAVLLILAMVPGLPAAVFLPLSAAAGASGWWLKNGSGQRRAQPEEAPPPLSEREALERLLKVDPIEVELGLGLISLVEDGPESALIRRVAAIRKQLASELGYLLPAVRFADNLSLKTGEYTIRIKGAEVERYQIEPGFELAIHSGAGAAPPLAGKQTREPTFGLPAWWVLPQQAEAARANGYTVVDPVSILGTHLSETIRRYAHEMFSRKDAKAVLDRVSEDNPRLVEDLVPKLLPLSIVQRVLQNLLREAVSIRDASTILEAISEGATMTKNPILLTEYVRQNIRRAIVQPHLSRNGELSAYFLHPSVEEAIESAVEHSENTSQLNLPPSGIRDVVERLQKALGSHAHSSVIVAGSGSRYFLRQIAEAGLRGVTVLAQGELPPGMKVVSLGVIQ